MSGDENSASKQLVGLGHMAIGLAHDCFMTVSHVELEEVVHSINV